MLGRFRAVWAVWAVRAVWAVVLVLSGPFCVAASAPAVTALADGSMLALLGSRYDAWTPVATDTTPLALMHVQGLAWDAAATQMQALFDDAHAYAELRGFQAMPAGEGSLGVLRAALYRTSINESVLLLDDDWCAAGLCKVRNRFVLMRRGQPDQTLSEKQLMPRILDSDLLVGEHPDCLKGITLGVEYVPVRSGTAVTALATVAPAVRQACDRAGTELALITRPLRLNWKASVRKFVRGW